MAEPLPKEFELVVKLIPFTPNVNKIIDIQIGNLNFLVRLLDGEKQYKLKVALDSNTYHKIIFKIHNTKTPKSIGINIDTRDIGVGFVDLKIEK